MSRILSTIRDGRAALGAYLRPDKGWMALAPDCNPGPCCGDDDGGTNPCQGGRFNVCGSSVESRMGVWRSTKTVDFVSTASTYSRTVFGDGTTNTSRTREAWRTSTVRVTGTVEVLSGDSFFYGLGPPYNLSNENQEYRTGFLQYQSDSTIRVREIWPNRPASNFDAESTLGLANNENSLGTLGRGLPNRATTLRPTVTNLASLYETIGRGLEYGAVTVYETREPEAGSAGPIVPVFDKIGEDLCLDLWEFDDPDIAGTSSRVANVDATDTGISQTFTTSIDGAKSVQVGENRFETLSIQVEGSEQVGAVMLEECSALAFLRPPYPIPEGFDPAEERRRTQQGGCCGQPSGLT